MTLTSSVLLSLALAVACGDKDDDDTGTGDGGATDGGGTGDGGGDGGTGDGGGDGGTGDGGTGDGGTGDGGAAGTADVRVVHLSPDAPAVDIWVAGGDAPVVSDLAYGEATAWLTVPEGAYDFQVKVHPSTEGDAPVYSTGALDLTDGLQVTALATGLVGSSAADDSFRVLPLVEDWAAPSAGTFRARIVHASPDAPPVALDVGNDGSAEVSDFERFADTDAVVPGGIPLPAGAPLQVGVWAGDPLAPVTAFTLPALSEGAEVLVLASGLLGQAGWQPTGFSLLALPAGEGAVVIRQNPVVYALHGSPDAPTVDIYAGDAEVVSGASFGDLVGPLQVPPGAYTLDFFASTPGTTRPAGSPAASASTGNLEGGETYLAMANGFLSDGSFTMLAWADRFERGDAANVRVRIGHASPDAPTVEVGPIEGGAVSSLGALAYGEDLAPEGLSLAPGPLPVGLALEGTTQPVITFDLDLSGLAGARFFALAAGSLTDPAAEAFRLLLVDTTSSPWEVLEVAPD
ncbi:DUF4397 domain-containing protein [Myxococcota bacterium]|nr:DUF4397 domain-containing protein [Myxococcota bacterium]